MSSGTALKSTQVSRYVFLLGKVHNKIGGPTRTIWGYVSGLLSLGHECAIAGLGSESEIRENFDEVGSSELIPIEGTLVRRIANIFSIYRKSKGSSSIILVGVWHLPFFIVGIIHLVYTLFGMRQDRRVVLIPTMSLTEYDWAKHALSKKALLPLVSLILRALNGVIFASSGELANSRPASFRNKKVILHPTVSIEHPREISGIERNIDILFAGRLDRQKDIPLLIETLSLMDPGVALDVAGDGEEGYKNELKILANQFDVSDRINWHGWKKHAATLDLLQRSRTVVVTSLVENFCHVAVEAIVSECDVVLVDRVMSAHDFAALADIDVVEPEAQMLASAITQRLGSWNDRNENRAFSAANVKDACRPATAAETLRQFISHPGSPSGTQYIS